MIEKNESKEFPFSIAILISLVAGVLFRWATACGPYSGQGKPPLFGDYEAQRHWMEITYSLPIQEWYFNTSDNDLLYWGLDYPPLTAYHSWILGAISKKLNASFVKLHDSRGYENYDHKLFMRYTVLFSDISIFLPAILLYVLKIQKPNADKKTKVFYLMTWLLYPGFILVDYGHFQYNCISLGLFLWAVIGILLKHDLWASFAFVLALSYKQMELYHALPFFCYLFGSCLRQRTLSQCFWKVTKLGIVVLTTFGVVWFPFLLNLRQLAQVFHRLFPFARGLFEDKVANVWCALSVVVKWRKYFEVQQLVSICALATIMTHLPMLVLAIWYPTKQNFKLSLIISSLVFFLFSFQVHEKSILLVSVPMLIILNDEPLASIWFLMITVVSLHPLCVKDEIQLAFFAFLFTYYIWTFDLLPSIMERSSAAKGTKEPKSMQLWFYHASIISGCLVCTMPLLFKPPERYPDLFPLINAVFCCFHFCCFLIYFYWKMMHNSFSSHVTKGKQKVQ